MKLADILSLPHKVNKETSVDGLPHSASVVRPKERRHDVHQQNPFMRGNTIIRSKTFSPGPQSQYICRVRTYIHTQMYLDIEIIIRAQYLKKVFLPIPTFIKSLDQPQRQ